MTDKKKKRNLILKGLAAAIICIMMAIIGEAVTPGTGVYALPAQTYEITYKDGGDLPFSGEHEYGYPQTGIAGTTTTLKGATKEGYEFGGWYADAACTGEPVTALELGGNITLYAKWDIYVASVTINGGTAVNYTSIEKAIIDVCAAMQNADDTATIKLIEDAQQEFLRKDWQYYYTIGRGTVTIDLNGQTLKDTKVDRTVAIYVNGGTLTITDSSTGMKKGTFYGDVLANGGNIILEKCNIITEPDTTGYWHSIRCWNNSSTITITDVTITGDNADGAIQNYIGKVHIYGGEVTNSKGPAVYSNAGYANEVRTYIYGGKFHGKTSGQILGGGGYCFKPAAGTTIEVTNLADGEDNDTEGFIDYQFQVDGEGTLLFKAVEGSKYKYGINRDIPSNFTIKQGTVIIDLTQTTSDDYKCLTQKLPITTQDQKDAYKEIKMYAGATEETAEFIKAKNMGTRIGNSSDKYVKFSVDYVDYDINYRDAGNKAFSGTHDIGYPTKHTYNTDTTLKSATKTGYEFGGWYIDADCTGDPVTSLSATGYTDTIILYAKWTVQTYTVTILAAGEDEYGNKYGSVSKSQVSNVPYGTYLYANDYTLMIGSTSVIAQPIEGDEDYAYVLNWSENSGYIHSDKTITATFTKISRVKKPQFEQTTVSKTSLEQSSIELILTNDPLYDERTIVFGLFDTSELDLDHYISNFECTLSGSQLTLTYYDEEGEPAAIPAGNYYICAASSETGYFSDLTGITINEYTELAPDPDPGNGGGGYTPIITPSLPTDSYTVPVTAEHTVQIKAEITEHKAVIDDITSADIDKITAHDNQEAAPVTTIAVDVSSVAGGVTEIQITGETLKKLLDAVDSTLNTLETVTFKTSEMAVALDGNALKAILEQKTGSTISLVVEKTQETVLNTLQQNSLKEHIVEQTFEAHFESDGQVIGDFRGGSATVTVDFEIPDGRSAEHYFINYVADNGDMIRYATKYVNNAFQYTTTHFSDYAIIYDEAAVNDTVTDQSGLTGNEIAGLTNLELLLAQGTTTDKGIKLTWNKVDNAVKYEVYWSSCNGKQNFKKLSSTKKLYASHLKLNVKKNYKYFVAAYRMVDGKKVYIAKSVCIHIAAKNSKYTNVKSVSTGNKKVSLTVNKTYTLSPAASKENRKKEYLIHTTNMFRYRTSDKSIAIVNSNGKITAKKAGTCYVYIIANNGVYKRVKVIVK